MCIIIVNIPINEDNFPDESSRFWSSIHEKVKAYLQKHGNINPKNPPKEFYIWIEITPDEDEHSANETWELSITYAPNEYSPLNTIKLKYIIKNTLFGRVFEDNGVNR